MGVVVFSFKEVLVRFCREFVFRVECFRVWNRRVGRKGIRCLVFRGSVL